MTCWWIHPCDGCKEFMKILIHQLVIVRSPPHVLLTLSHILINFQVIHHERIHALAKPISRQTQDNSYSKFAFAKPSALSHTPNDVVGIIFRLAAATPFVAVKRISFLHLGHS
ncbi:hypothetical protein TNCV_1303141 [Trichonephila clavipes]|nr:hypothetical protein TNCV_1303141 [Trichonephila clavipes]